MGLFDVGVVNQALGKTGSQHQFEEEQPAPASMTPMAAPPPVEQPEAPAPVAQPAAGATPGAAGWGQKIASGTNAMANVVPEDKTAEGMKKIGALVGTVLSVYSGNAMGAMNGVKSMSDSSKGQH